MGRESSRYKKERDYGALIVPVIGLAAAGLLATMFAYFSDGFFSFLKERSKNIPVAEQSETGRNIPAAEPLKNAERSAVIVRTEPAERSKDLKFIVAEPVYSAPQAVSAKKVADTASVSGVEPAKANPAGANLKPSGQYVPRRVKGKYAVQIGSFGRAEAAAALLNSAKKAGFFGEVRETARSGRTPIYRTAIYAGDSRVEADRTAEALTKSGVAKDFLVVSDG